jgi:DNA-binding response OmpR family regulator
MAAKILIVDDDLQSLKLIGLMLQRRGYTIVAACGGAQGLAKAESDQPDLVILDVMMPDIDGLEVCRKLRSQPSTRHIPIVMLTARTLVRDKLDGIRVGIDDYLTKPIHPNDLAARVDAVLQRSARQRAETPPTSTARVIGFLGAKSGVGTTTLALNTAAALATAKADRRVILADLQSSAANVAAQLRLDPAGGLTALTGLLPHEITPALIGARLVRQVSGLQLLLASAEHSTALTAAQLTALLNSLSQLAQFVLLDLGSNLDDVTLAALNQCQQVVLALKPQRIAATAARNLIAQLERHGVPAARLTVVLINRTPDAVALDRSALEAQLNLPIHALLPPVPEVASQAADQASLILLIQPSSLIAEQFRALAQHLAN